MPDEEMASTLVRDVMTSESLITAPEGISREDALALFAKLQNRKTSLGQ